VARTGACESQPVSCLIDPESIRVGADIVELLTSGMYVSPITVFREYVQNAADAIDAAREQGLLGPEERGKVVVEVNQTDRSVTVRDNGAGVPADNVADILLAIGGSSKRGTHARGFRGVGRLSGLAYCRELSFRTKAAGELLETTVRWDALALRSGISAARAGTDLRQVIANSVHIENQPNNAIEEHFFEVTLRGVVRHRQDVLINEHAIAHYLSQIAPLPFSSEFSSGSAITERLAQAGRMLVPIDLTVAGQTVERPYRDRLAQPGTDKQLALRDVEFFQLLDVDGEVGAIGWIAHHDYVRSISTTMGVRGLRARVGDVQVGDADLFDNSFREPRFNGWTVGEVHILDRRILPNGRRDNFEVSSHSNNLLVQLAPITADVSQRCRSSSVGRNATTIIRNTIVEADRLLAQETIDPSSLSRCKAAVVRGRQKLKGIEEDEVRVQLAADLQRIDLALTGRSASAIAGVVAADEAIALVGKIVTNRDQATKLIAALRALEA
jgi:hypothetical protein